MRTYLVQILLASLFCVPLKTTAQSGKVVDDFPDTAVLDEIMVTGTGSPVSTSKLAVAVHSLQVKNKIAPPSADIGQFLVGKIAGAQISSINGSPGSPVNILLRGVNTVMGFTKPVILLDGLEVKATRLQSLDINTIDRIEIAAGASAGSLYGAQGANGVIQLFSKKGNSDRITIDFSSSVSLTRLLNTGNVHHARLHAFVTNQHNEVIDAGGHVISFSPITSDYSANAQYDPLSPLSIADKVYNRNFQYQDLYKTFLQKGYITNNILAVSGSKGKSDFYVALSTNKQNSNFKGNGKYSRSNFTANTGIELAENLKFRSLTQLIYTRNSLNDPTGRNILFGLNNTRPFADYTRKDIDGNYGYYYGDVAGLIAQNPNYINQYSSRLVNTFDVLQNFNLNYTFQRFAEMDIKYGINVQQEGVEKRYENQQFNRNAANQQYWIGNFNPNTNGATTGEINIVHDRTVCQHFIATVFLRTDFKNDFNLNIPVTTSTQVAFDHRRNNYKHFLAYGYDAPDYNPWNASQAGVYKIAADYNEPFVTYGILVNHRFDYNQAAGISFGWRSDWSSAFGSGSKAQVFPRGDIYINLAKFKFWQKPIIPDCLTLVKLRAAFGSAGIQPGAFQRFPTLGTANLGLNSLFIFPLQAPNKNLAVEVSKETEWGTDIRFRISERKWFNRAGFSFTKWARKTRNAIYYTDNAPSTGIGSFLDNAFGLKSDGFELSVDLDVLAADKIQWKFITLFSRQRSVIASINGNEIVVPTAAGTANYVLKAGERIGQLYGYILLTQVDQIDPNTGQSFIAAAQQANYEVADNGYVVNKTTKQPFASGSQYALGDANPDFNMGFINTVSYKNIWSLSIQWDWIAGSHLYNQTKSWMYRDGISSDYTIPVSITNPATGVREAKAYTAFYRGVYGAGINNGTKNYFYENASFLRLRNISLSLDMTSLLRLKQIRRLELILSAANIITITRYTGMDPEISSGTVNSAFDRGVDHNTIPNTRNYTAGINVRF